jgi:trans-2,3-dihydro-3-hydroxyanthranilate isomerase
MGASRRRLTGLPITLVQACLRGGGGGSPTAIVTEETWLSDDERRQVPELANASHAVFVDAEAEEGAVLLRFFTREGELPACGHGTVAALALLAEHAGGPEYQARLRTAAGREIRGRAERQGDLMAAEFEAGRVGLREPTAEEVARVLPALGLAAQSPSSGTCVATLGRPRILVPVSSRSVLDALDPDLRLLRDACLGLGLLGCYVYTVPAHAEPRSSARMFAPAIGVPEDIANANSTACLAAHLHASGAGTSRVTVHMGDSLGSPATITATVADSAPNTLPLVYVGGTAKVARTIVLR